MITIKNTRQFAKMAEAGRCVAAVHRAMIESAKVGVKLEKLDAVAAKIIDGWGCRPSFLGYKGFPAHTCVSPNAVVVHGIPDSYRLAEGDILSVDAGAIYKGYHADAAFTFPIGVVDDDVAQLIAVTRQALWAGIDQVQVGNRVGDIGHAVEEAARPFEYGVVTEYVGHGIGRAMHEDPQVPNIGPPGKGARLKTGMALCVEPMFNLGTADTRVRRDGWTVVTADGRHSAHFEHTVALTPDGPRVLTVADLLTSRPDR